MDGRRQNDGNGVWVRLVTVETYGTDIDASWTGHTDVKADGKALSRPCCLASSYVVSVVKPYQLGTL